MILTMKDFGGNGRLGNQLFQYASLIGIADKHGYDLVIPEWEYAKYFNIALPKQSRVAFKDVQEKVFHWDESFLEKGHINIQKSYLQSERYWKHCKEKVLKNLKFEKTFKVECLAKALPAFNKKTIAIHIRRGDYVGNKNYEQLSISYYINALMAIPNWKNCNVLVFSDDIKYCKVHFRCLDNVYFPNLSDIEDLCLMSCCDKHIIGNSTFGWWGAYLSESPVVIRPDKYFDGPLLRNDTKDFWPREWAVLPDEKIDLKDTTFMIPVKKDSQDRAENLELTVDFLRMHFDAEVIVCEQGGEYFCTHGKYFINFHLWMKFKGRDFHRTKMLNEMAMTAQGKILVNWDCDVLIAPLQLLLAIEKVRNKEAAIVSPYDWRFARIQRQWYPKLRKSVDIGIVGGFEETFVGYQEGSAVSWGGAIIYDKETFFTAGGENENFISFGPEDQERIWRFTQMGYKPARQQGPVFHLNHYMGIDSSKKHKHFKRNQEEFEKIRKMDFMDLFSYIETWEWRKKMMLYTSLERPVFGRTTS